MIIPAINYRDYEEAAVAAKKISEFSEWAHIDVGDGVFTPNVSWGNLEEFSHLASELPLLRFEVHLMVVNPEEVIEQWFKAGAERVIVHFEAMTDPHRILEVALKYRSPTAIDGGRVMLAINPGTSAEELVPYLNSFPGFQVLAVPPGPSGQKFNESVLEKMKFLREKAPNAIIEVDGGINPETAELVREAGANILVSGSYIMNSPDPKGAFQALEEA
ncbi:MAG: ribulose-phosphate 3-epimerase [Candidatus Colwellbacteria bacterium]|nr:ribulose-phosphate 3-epimerase [Candidatus Colwellbacteria bacterium]